MFCCAYAQLSVGLFGVFVGHFYTNVGRECDWDSSGDGSDLKHVRVYGCVCIHVCVCIFTL